MVLFTHVSAEGLLPPSAPRSLTYTQGRHMKPSTPSPTLTQQQGDGRAAMHVQRPCRRPAAPHGGDPLVAAACLATPPQSMVKFPRGGGSCARAGGCVAAARRAGCGFRSIVQPIGAKFQLQLHRITVFVRAVNRCRKFRKFVECGSLDSHT